MHRQLLGVETGFWLKLLMKNFVSKPNQRSKLIFVFVLGVNFVLSYNPVNSFWSIVQVRLQLFEMVLAEHTLTYTRTLTQRIYQPVKFDSKIMTRKFCKLADKKDRPNTSIMLWTMKLQPVCPGLYHRLLVGGVLCLECRTHTHTYIHMCTHNSIRAQTCTHIPVSGVYEIGHTHTHTCIHMCTHNSIRAQTCTHTHSLSCIFLSISYTHRHTPHPKPTHPHTKCEVRM